MSDTQQPIRAGGIRLLNKAGLIERVAELLEAEDMHCAEIARLRKILERIASDECVNPWREASEALGEHATVEGQKAAAWWADE